MSILVTGGAGFLGSHVVRTLKQNGEDVIVLDKANCNEDVTSIVSDVNDLETLERYMKEYDISTVVHLVGFPHIGMCEKNPHLSFKLNTLSTQNVVEAMRKSDARKIIFASSASVYGYGNKQKVCEEDPPAPDTIYGFHKWLSELIIESYYEVYEVNFVIFRIFNIYGGDPFRRNDVISLFIRNMLERKPLVLIGPDKFRDFIHVEDVALAFQRACNKDVSGTFNVGSGVKVSLRQLASIFKSISPALQIVEEMAPDDGTGVFADTSLARKLLDFEARDPVLGISEYVKEFV